MKILDDDNDDGDRKRCARHYCFTIMVVLVVTNNLNNLATVLKFHY